MSAQKQYDILNNSILNKDHEYSSNILRLYRFFYHDILDEFAKEIERIKEVKCTFESHFDKSSCDIKINKLTTTRTGLSKYIDDDDSNAIDIFYDLMNDEEAKEAMNKFFAIVQPFFDIVDVDGFNQDKFSPQSYAINIYMMLKACKIFKNSSEDLDTILDNFSKLIPRSILGNSEMIYKKSVIDFALDEKDPKTVMSLIDFFSLYMQDFNNLGKSPDLESSINIINMIKRTNEAFDTIKDKSNKEDKSKIISCIIEKADECYVFPAVLYNNRFDYFRKSLNEVEKRKSLRKDIADRIGNINYKLFDYLNSRMNDTNTDSFVECMNIIFDSDTYLEVKNKIDVLREAGLVLESGDISLVDKLVCSLNDIKHKSRVGDKLIAFTNIGQNKIQKPVTILERMKGLYGLVLPSVDLGEEIDEDIRRSFELDLDSVISIVDERVEKEKKSYDRYVLEKANERGANEKIEERKEQEIKQDLVVPSENTESNQSALQKVKTIFGIKRS